MRARAVLTCLPTQLTTQSDRSTNENDRLTFKLVRVERPSNVIEDLRRGTQSLFLGRLLLHVCAPLLCV
jgi:hypothetical protein